MKKGLLLIILAGAMWGTSCIFVNTLAPFGFSSQQIVAMRMGIAAFFMFLYCLFFNRQALKIQLKQLPIFALCGICLFSNACFYFESMQLTSASTAVVLMYISPVPIILISVIFLKEKFTLIKEIGVPLMLIGCVLVAGIIGNFKPNTLGIVMGFLSAAANTAYCVLNKIAAKRQMNPVSFTFYTFVFSAVCAFAVCNPGEMPGMVAQKPLVIVPMFMIQSLVTCLLPYLFYSMSLKYLSVGVASAMSIIEPMTGALLGIIIFHDRFTLLTVLGMVLVIASVFLLGIGELNGGKKRTGAKTV